MAGKFSHRACALLFLFALSARAAWSNSSPSSSEIEKATAAGVEHRRIIFGENSTGNEATLDIALFSPKSTVVRVIDNPDGDELAAAIRRVRGVAGVNGGYFDPENAPVGLVIADGKMIAPFRKAKLLSGVMVVTKGRVELLRAAEYSSRKNATSAIQCGPLLVDDGKAVTGLNATRPARRTFVFTTGTDRCAIGCSSTVTLAGLGEILAAPELKVRRALNLDGGSSSAFWFSGENGVTSIAERKTVRNFVVIAPK